MQHDDRSVLDDQDFVQFCAQIDLSRATSALTGIILIHEFYSFIPECQFKIGDLHLWEVSLFYLNCHTALPT